MSILDTTTLETVESGRDVTLAAADIKAEHPIAFAAALAQQHRATLVTGDPGFRQLDDILDIPRLS